MLYFLTRWKDRLKFFFILGTIIFFLLTFKLVQLHISGKAPKPEHDRFYYTPRGNIYSRNGKELAVSEKCFSLGIHPNLYPFPPELIDTLSSLIDTSPQKLEEKIKNFSHYKFLSLKRKFLPYLQGKELEKKLKKYYKYIELEAEYKRVYPKEELASHLLGLVSSTKEGLNIGIEGLERYYDSWLRSATFTTPAYVDAYGNLLLTSLPSGRGNYHIQLTIDEYIQAVLEEEIERRKEEIKADWICGIILDPNSGELLALSNFPTFNPNRRENIKNELIKNRAIMDLCEPGSIFKLFTAAALLEEKPDIDKVKLFCPGEALIGRRIIHCIHKHEEVTFSEILEKSCNIGIAQLLVRHIPPSKFVEYIKKFGFLDKTGITLPGETKGYICTSVEKLEKDIATYATLAFGQGIVTTPLRLAISAAAMVNGGILYKPMVVKALLSYRGQIYKIFKPKIIRRIIKESTSFKLAELMTKVVETGTGKKAKIPHYIIGGKTGTAQKLPLSSTSPKYIASFVGWFPYYKPDVLILIMADNPKGGSYYGGEVAAPIFQGILKRLIPYLNLQPNEIDSMQNAEVIKEAYAE
jgi:stage V sporulation protein D (sporulation-specific penicillin-binding protein)